MTRPRKPGVRFGGKRRSDWKPTRPDWAVLPARSRGAEPKARPLFTRPELRLIYRGVKDLKTTDTKRVERLLKKLMKLGVKDDPPNGGGNKIW